MYAVENKSESLDDLSLEELMNIKIYSATKSYQRIEEIPANITVITRKDIEKYNYTTLDELLKHVPGLFIIDDTEHFQIGSRGSLGSSFKLMINNNEISPLRIPTGASSNRNFFATPVEAIDRIEIIKGPQAVTYGSNAMYGSINIITNDFNEKNIVSVSKGNNGQEKVFARINHKYEDGGFTLNTSFYNTDGISGDLKDSFSQDDFNRYTDAVKSLNGLLENNYKTLDFSHRYKNLTTDINYSHTNYGIYLYPTYRNGSEVKQIEKSLAFTYEDELGDDLSYKANFITSQKTYDIDNLNISSNSTNTINNHVKDKRNQLDFHLNNILNHKMKLLIGFTYKIIEENASLTYINTYQTQYKFNEMDIYSKLQYKINDKLEVNGGIRFTKKNDFIVYYNPGNNDYIKDKRSYLPEFSAIYHIDSNNHIKLLYGKANQLTYSGTHKFEEINSSELNYIYLSKKYQVNSSIFYNEAKNISLFTREGSSNKTSPIGNKKTKGLQFTLTYKPNYSFETISSITFQDTQNKTTDGSINYEPSFSPKVLSKFQMSYIKDKTRYSLLLNYISKMKSSIDSSTGIRYGKESNHNINLGLNLNHKLNKDLSLNLNITNILDRDNRTPAGSTLTNFENGAFSKGREYLVTLKYKF
jgi:outer membrane receptor protein involved in Fe transport